MAFHDETLTTAQKALARQAHARASTTTAPSHLTWENQSRIAFLSLYVGQLSRSFDSLPSLLVQSPADGHLHASVNAASLALMAFQLSYPGLTHLASLRYVDAIRSLRLALHSSELSAGTDEILQTVLLLDLYEKITNRGAQHRGAWMTHAQGALDMVNSRASDDFSSPVTCQLANRVATAVIISCGTAGVPVPDTIGTLRQGLSCYVRDTKWSLTGLVVNVVNLRADMRSAASTPGSRDSTAGNLRRAKELDENLAFLAGNMTRFWKPQRVLAKTNDPLVFGRYYDLYRTQFATQVSNAIRMMRLEMCSIICSLDPEEQADLHSPSSKTIDDMTRQICAAVPQFLLPEARPDNTLPLSPLQKLQCCTSLTPLYASAQLTRDSHLRDWILQCVAHMAENGVKIAQDVHRMLRLAPEVDYWTVYAMVGSYAIAA